MNDGEYLRPTVICHPSVPKGFAAPTELWFDGITCPVGPYPSRWSQVHFLVGDNSRLLEESPQVSIDT